MHHPRDTRVLQIRVTGADGQAQAVLGYLATYYAYLAKGTNTAARFAVRRHVRSGGRAGHIRAYLTISRKE
jgi:hypothetical protein